MPFFPEPLDSEVREQLGVGDDHRVVFSASMISMLPCCDVFYEAIAAREEASGLPPSPSEANELLDEVSVDVDLPRGTLVVGVESPDGERTYGLVQFSETALNRSREEAAE